MKRYSPSISYFGEDDHPCADMAEDPGGLYVLASEVQAEIDRLRALVEAAYREGTGVLYVESQEDEDTCWLHSEDTYWLHSDARKSLTPPPAGKEQT